MGGACRPVRHTGPALPTHQPATGQEDNEEEEEEEEETRRRRRRRRREMIMYRGGGGVYLNLMIQNVVRQNALIRADHIS